MSDFKRLKELYGSNPFSSEFIATNKGLDPNQQVEADNAADTGIRAEQDVAFNQGLTGPVSTDNGMSYDTINNDGSITYGTHNPNNIANGSLFDNAETKDQGEENIYRQRYLDDLKKELHSLTLPNKRLSEEDQIKINQIQYELANPDKAAIMARQGYNPNNYQTTLNKSDNSYLKQVNDVFTKLDKMTQRNANTDPNKLDTVYVYQDDHGHMKVGFAAHNAKDRYSQQDIVSQGYHLVKSYKVKDGIRWEQKLHTLLKQSGVYNGPNNTFGSGKTEVYDYQAFKSPSDAEAVAKYNALVNQDELDKNTAYKLQAQKYDGYLSEMVDALQSGAYHLVGAAGAGVSELGHDIYNHTLGSKDDTMHYGAADTFFKKLRDKSDQVAGYNPKDEEEMSKNYDMGVAQFNKGDIFGAALSFAKMLKGVPTTVIKSVPDIAVYSIGGPEMIGAKALATSVAMGSMYYNQYIDNYKKNNNGREPNDTQKIVTLGASIANQYLQRGGVDVVLNGTKTFIGANGHIFGRLRDIAKYAPKDVAQPLIRHAIIKVGGQLASKASEGFVAEAIAEAGDQLTQTVSERLNSDKYKDMSFEDIVKDSAYDIIKSGVIGGLTGGAMSIGFHPHEILNKPINELQQQKAQRFNQDALATIQHLPETSNDPSITTKQDIRQKAESKLSEIEQEHRQTINEITKFDKAKDKTQAIKDLVNEEENTNIESNSKTSDNTKSYLNNNEELAIHIDKAISKYNDEVDKINEKNDNEELQHIEPTKEMSNIDKLKLLTDNIDSISKGNQNKFNIINPLHQTIKNVLASKADKLKNIHHNVKLIHLSTNPNSQEETNRNFIQKVGDNLFGSNTYSPDKHSITNSKNKKLDKELSNKEPNELQDEVNKIQKQIDQISNDEALNKKHKKEMLDHLNKQLKFRQDALDLITQRNNLLKMVNDTDINNPDNINEASDTFDKVNKSESINEKHNISDKPNINENFKNKEENEEDIFGSMFTNEDDYDEATQEAENNNIPDEEIKKVNETVNNILAKTLGNIKELINSEKGIEKLKSYLENPTQIEGYYDIPDSYFLNIKTVEETNPHNDSEQSLRIKEVIETLAMQEVFNNGSIDTVIPKDILITQVISAINSLNYKGLEGELKHDPLDSYEPNEEELNKMLEALNKIVNNTIECKG